MKSPLRPRIALALASLALPLVGCTASAPADPVLERLVGSERLEILALHPFPHEPEGTPVAGADFHGYRILARADVADAEERDAVLALVRRGIAESDGRVAACFNPRHGLSFTSDGHTTDLVICFECLSMTVYVDGAREGARLTTATHAAEVTEHFTAHGLAIHAGG